MSELAKALLAFQKDAPDLHKDSRADTGKFSYKYLSLDAAMEQIRPLLNTHGLTLLQFPSTVNGQPALRTKLLHESGEFEEDTMLLLNASDPQGQGSALTYARRYSLMAVLSLVADEDDDGAKAQASPQRQSSSPPAADAQPAEKRTPAQVGMLKELLEALYLQEKRPNAATDKTWTDLANEYAREQFGHPAGDSLSRDEYQQVIEYMRPFLKEGWTPDIPFTEREAAA